MSSFRLNHTADKFCKIQSKDMPPASVNALLARSLRHATVGIVQLPDLSSHLAWQ